MTYRISTVAEVTGIPRNTLLAWERRYGLVRPIRHDNGYRSYTDDDVAIILRLRNAIAAGLRIGEAVELIKKQAQSEPKTITAPDASSGELEGLCSRVLHALLEYRRSDAEELLTELRAIPIAQRAREFYFPLLRELRSEILEHKLSIAQGHFATTTLRSHLVSVLVATDSAPRTAPHAATTTFPHESYELIALAVAIQLAAAGFRVSYLGAGLSSEELVEYVRTKQPSLICVSCSAAPEEAALLNYVDELERAGPSRFVLGELSKGPKALEGVVLLHRWEELEPGALLAQARGESS